MKYERLKPETVRLLGRVGEIIEETRTLLGKKSLTSQQRIREARISLSLAEKLLEQVHDRFVNTIKRKA